MNAVLERIGGHVGYVVVPECRGRGYATAILAKAVAIARDELGIARVLVTCEENNLASIKVIERNGGVPDGVTHETSPPHRRYWIG